MITIGASLRYTTCSIVETANLNVKFQATVWLNPAYCSAQANFIATHNTRTMSLRRMCTSEL